MSFNKKRPREEADVEIKRLAELVDLDYDRTAIDDLVSTYVQGCKHDDVDAAAENLVCCPRSYEESYLHEPIGTQRACARNNDCEGLKLQGTGGFILREFVYPGTEPSETRQLCLLCRRHEISSAYYKYETGQQLKHSKLQISRHYNLVGIPGEYDVRDCIVSSGEYSGLLLPVVLHIRSAYTCHMKDGVRHLIQSRMRCPGRNEDSEPGGFLGRRAGLTTNLARSALACGAE